MRVIGRWKKWTRRLSVLVHAVYLAARDRRVPWYARALAIAVAGYALSPIDLIPDFIPVLGYVDDLILLPLGVALVIRLVPPPLWAECTTAPRDRVEDRRLAAATAVVVVLLWAAVAVWLWHGLWHGLTTGPVGPP